MARNQLSKPSQSLHMQPIDARTPQNMSPALSGDVPHSGPLKLNPIQLIRDRTAKRKNQLAPRSTSLPGSSNTPKTVPVSRKPSEPTTLHRTSRAPSESVELMLEPANASNSQTLPRNQSHQFVQWTGATLDTPLSTGILFSFGQPGLSPPCIVSGEPEDSSSGPHRGATRTERRDFDAEKMEIEKRYEAQLAGVWLAEMVAQAIIKYYQGERGELIEGLTRATYMAQQYDYKDLMGRAQLWKAIIFDEMGETANIPSILSDVISLIRDFGDDMDCYQLRKLLPVYGHAIFRHLMVHAKQRREPDTASAFNSPAAQSAYEAWFKWQISCLDQKYIHEDWPNPLAPRYAARVSQKSTDLDLTFQSELRAANASLLGHKTHLENMLMIERIEHENSMQELADDRNRLRAMIYGHQAGGDIANRTAESSRNPSVAISPGLITTMNEALKAGRPRSTEQIDRWLHEHKKPSPASSQREEWRTPTHTASIYERERTDSMASLVDRHMSFVGFNKDLLPRPLKIQNPDSSPFPASSSRERQDSSQSRGKSGRMHSHDGRRTQSRSSPGRASRAAGSTNWRRLDGKTSQPKFTSPATPEQRQIRAANDGNLSSFVSEQSITGIHSRPLPCLDTSKDLQFNGKSNDSNRTGHGISEGPSGPRLLPRRASLPSPTMISPLTIDSPVERHLTDTPSPTKLQHTISAFRNHQEQYRRHSSTAISPRSMSYEVERKRSHAFVSMGARENGERKVLVGVSKGLDSNAGKSRGQKSEVQSKDESSSAGDVQTSSNTSSNKFSLGRKGISVGHGIAITGVSGDLSNLAQESESTASISASNKESDKQRHVDAPVVSQVSNLDLDSFDSSGQGQSTATALPTDTDTDTVPFNRIHQRQGSIPAIPSPLREAFRADDIQDQIQSSRKQEDRDEASRAPHATNIGELITFDRSRQPSVRDFAYGQGSETSDLYGVSHDSSELNNEADDARSSGLSDRTRSSSSRSGPLDEQTDSSTHRNEPTTSSVRVSKFYEDIENGYLSPIASDYGSHLPSYATSSDSWSRNSSVRMSAVIPGLNIKRVLQQRDISLEQAPEVEKVEKDYDDDEAVSLTAQPRHKVDITKPPRKLNADQREVMRESFMNLSSLADLEEELQAEANAKVRGREAEILEEIQEPELTEEEMCGICPEDESVKSKSTVDSNTTDNEHKHIMTPPETEAVGTPRSKEEFAEDNVSAKGSDNQANENGPDGELEVLLPRSYYVPPSQQGEESGREEMQKEMWSTGIN